MVCFFRNSSNIFLISPHFISIFSCSFFLLVRCILLTFSSVKLFILCIYPCLRNFSPPPRPPPHCHRPITPSPFLAYIAFKVNTACYILFAHIVRRPLFALPPIHIPAFSTPFLGSHPCPLCRSKSSLMALVFHFHMVSPFSFLAFRSAPLPSPWVGILANVAAFHMSSPPASLV